MGEFYCSGDESRRPPPPSARLAPVRRSRSGRRTLQVEHTACPASCPACLGKVSQSADKPNSVPFNSRRLAAAPAEGDDHSSRPVIAHGLERPTRWPRTGRPIDAQLALDRRRHPIWSCSMRGFACHRRYRRRGALLPHLFTLTRLRPPDFGEAGPRNRTGASRACLAEAPEARRRAVYFLCHWSVRLPCPGVTRRTALWSSDFPLLPVLHPPRQTRHAVT
jgi:hypothetical protein